MIKKVKRIKKIKGVYVDPEMAIRAQAIKESEEPERFVVVLENVGWQTNIVYTCEAELKQDMRTLGLKKVDKESEFYIQPDFVYDIVEHEMQEEFENKYYLAVYSFGCKAPLVIPVKSEAEMSD